MIHCKQITITNCPEELYDSLDRFVKNRPDLISVGHIVLEGFVRYMDSQEAKDLVDGASDVEDKAE